MNHTSKDVGRVNVLILLVSIIPLLGVIAAGFWWWGKGLTGLSLTLFLIMHFFTGIGITVGFHRLFTHKSFETSDVLKYILGVLGSMGLEGRIIEWVTDHRLHHQYSDDEGDPHSPVYNRKGWWQRTKGFVHAHYGWMLTIDDVRDYDRYSPDLQKDPVVKHVDRFFLLWVLLGLLIPTVLGGIISGSWIGAFLGFLWGGPVRIFTVHHITWSINSLCHTAGTQPFRSHDSSRNNLVAGLMGLGEGWHNNHHAFPTSARHGLRWWEFDASWELIRLLSILGLVWNVRLPNKKQMEEKRHRAA
jgi:stearoyl-CoA desaturase (delta-9 desaturase)